MKKLLLLFIVLAPVFLQAQTTIDRAMSVWARTRVNANFTESYTNIADNLNSINTLSDSLVTELLKADSANINEAVIDTLEVDSVITRVLDYEPPHGSLLFADSTSTLGLTEDTWAKVTNENNDLYTVDNNDGLTMEGDSITIITPGDYIMWVTMSFNGNSQDVYHCAIYKNAVVTPVEMHRKTSNNDTGNMGMSGIFDNLIAGDDLALYIQNTANDNDPTFISSQITILMIHPR